MKKLLLILLCLPFIGFGQKSDNKVAENSLMPGLPGFLLGQVDVKIVGKFSRDMENHIKEFDGFFMLDFFFSEDALAVMGRDLYDAPGDDMFEYDEKFAKNLTRVVGKERGEALLADLQMKDDFSKFPEEMKHSIVFAKTNFKWDDENKAFISKGSIGVGSVLDKQVNSLVDGYIIIEKGQSTDVLTIYIQTEFYDEYYFQYKNGVMRAWSTNPQFNAAILSVPDRKRKAERTKGAQAYRYMIAPEDIIVKFLKQVKKYNAKNDVLLTYNTTSNNTKSPMIDLSVKGKIQTFVEKRVNEWQKKGEFEKTNDYLLRVNEKNRTVKIKEFQETEIESLKLNFLNSIDFSNIELGDYDADNETFLLEDSKLGNLVISVPINEAKLFKANFPYYKFAVPKCVVIDDKFVLSYVELTFGNVNPNGTVGYGYRKYSYNLNITQDYSLTEIDYNFSAIEIDDIASAKKTKSSNISTNKIKVGTSSVNINIPTNEKVKNRYALIIGNEDYTSFQRTLSSEQNVDYAVNDATIFKQYCLNTLGVQEENMNFLTNATAGAMNQKINKMLKLMNKLGNEAELIVYYAGHGYPDELTKVPYLIPVDVSGTDLSYAIKLEGLYRDLGNTNAQVTVFLDACFTGGGRNSGLVASRGVKVKPKEGTLNGNIVVFSASSGNQSALPYHQQGHGMFTYHLLKKLQESKGKVSMGELADYITNEVSIQSININEKEQDPKVNTSQKLVNDWRNWKF